MQQALFLLVMLLVPEPVLLPNAPLLRDDLVSFEEILAEVRLLSEDNPQEAILLLKGILGRYTSDYQLYETSWLLFSTFFEEGRYQECLAVWQVEQGRGLFFPILPEHELKLSSFDAFRPIYQENERLRGLAQLNHKATYEVRKPPGYLPGKKMALLMVLHDDNSNICWMNQLWRSDRLDAEFLVVFLRSSEKVGSFAFSWSDRSLEDVKGLYDRIQNEYSIDEDRIIVGGYGRGASIALEAAITGAIPCKGLLAFCPTAHSLEMRLGKHHAGKGVRACLIASNSTPRNPKSRA